jgi:hypothetical protein
LVFYTKGIIRLRVLENSVLRRLLEPDRDEVTGGLRTFHIEESHNFSLLAKYYQNGQIKEEENTLENLYEYPVNGNLHISCAS